MDYRGAARPSLVDRAPSSVGDVLETQQVYSIHHPAYKHFSEAVAEQLEVLAQREVVRRSSAKSLVLPYSLDSEQVSRLAVEFPEFVVTSLPMAKPVHSTWAAMRAAANEWLAVSIARYGEDVVHFGGGVLSNILAGRRSSHVEVSMIDDVAVHGVYAERVATERMFTSAVDIAVEQHVALPRPEYDHYLRGEAYTQCTSPASCCHAADAVCMDLTVLEMSPQQVALSMAQHGATVAQGFFIYDPAMMVQDRGELAETGVHFQRTEREYRFLYPEGRVGVAKYDRMTWSRWCSSHTFSIGPVGKQKWFQLELMKHRGPFMFFRMAMVPAPSGPVRVTHALDLVEKDKYTVVKSWRLRDGFLADPTDGRAWEPNNFLVRARVVRRAYEFAMQLPPASFTRHAVKKQIRVVNDRWVVSGTSVLVAPPLEPQQLEDLTTAVYARAFVDRYDSSQLSSEMMAALGATSRFRDMSAVERGRAVLSAVTTDLYLAVGRLDATIRAGVDGFVDYLTGKAPAARLVAFDRAPEYVTLSSVVGGWMSTVMGAAERFYAVDDATLRVQVNPAAPGGLLAAAYAAVVADGGVEEHDPQDLVAVMRVVTDVLDTSLHSAGDALREFSDQVRRLNEVDQAPSTRMNLEYEAVQRGGAEIAQAFRNGVVADPVYSLNQLYADVLPGMATTEVKYDTFSLSLDPQDRTLAAPYLRMPSYFGLPPAPRLYYVSKLRALSVPKRQNTAQELLSAISARNLSAPAIAQPQEEEILIRDIWDTFLDRACVSGARAKLASFSADPVSLAEDELKDWASKAKPDVVARLVKEMEENSTAMGEKRVEEYLVMIKADVKPTMSEKPVHELTAPQVIVYHDKLLSALYSSIFRVLVRRFLSLLRPEYHVNLLKDTADIQAFITGCHPFGTAGLQYLENDFSKFDKSQSAFAFMLEAYVFQQLGLNEEMLAAWVHGHVDCTLRSVSVGLSLHVLYQRKSGDATTAFGNVLLNVLAVTYAYRGTSVVWAVFMGDDSIVCASRVSANAQSVQLLAEVFNLTAKFYVTGAPYFASNFILLDGTRHRAVMCPDPIKRVERLSMSVSADDPQWTERWVSFQDSMSSFMDPAVAQMAAVAVPQRYPVQSGFVRDAADTLGYLCRSESAFRDLWSADPEVISA